MKEFPIDNEETHILIAKLHQDAQEKLHISLQMLNSAFVMLIFELSE